jgi:hypothetical protein
MGEYEEVLKEEKGGEMTTDDEYFSAADVTGDFVKKEEELDIDDTFQAGNGLLRYKQTYW